MVRVWGPLTAASALAKALPLQGGSDYGRPVWPEKVSQLCLCSISTLLPSSGFPTATLLLPPLDTTLAPSEGWCLWSMHLGLEPLWTRGSLLRVVQQSSWRAWNVLETAESRKIEE